MEVQYQFRAGVAQAKHLGSEIIDSRCSRLGRNKCHVATPQPFLDFACREVSIAGRGVQQPNTPKIAYTPIEHCINLELLHHRAAENERRPLIDETLCDVSRDRWASNQRNAGTLQNRRKGKHIAAADRPDYRGNIIILDQALRERNGALRIGLIIIDQDFDASSWITRLVIL